MQSASDVEKALTHRKNKSDHSGYESPVKVMALTLSSSSIANSRTAIGIDSLSKESLNREFERRKSDINDKKEPTTVGTRSALKSVFSSNSLTGLKFATISSRTNCTEKK